MKVSVNKIRFINLHYDTGANLVPGSVEELVEKIGSQLGAVEEVNPFGDKFDGVIIVKVVESVKHPDADKLSLCKIDDGGAFKDVERDANGLVQVVCGAPNVRADMLAAWVPPGITVPFTVGTAEPFVLEAREIRGKKSNGMLASLKELGIGDDHSGILEVDVDVKPGTSFAKAYRLEGEVVLDLENKMFTHRPDCFGLLGIAREVAGIQHQTFKSPPWYTQQPKLPEVEAEILPLKIHNELPKLVPRFTGIVMSGIEVKPSPVWLQIVLTEAGIRPINNIVDYTNFFMLETGQPLHAYDYDKVKALSGGEATITVRQPSKGEKLTLLNGKTVEPRPEDILIATDKQAIGMGGVMGGSETEVDENTKNIILECANFDMYTIRRTSMAHGLFTDAVTRFTKGQSPLQNLAVSMKTVDEIRKFAGGKVASELIDDNHVSKEALGWGSVHPPVETTAEFINARLGLKLATDEIKKLLTNVEFQVESKGDKLTVKAPFWRTDIEIPEDVVEEVGRLYGYDHLPLELPKRDLTPTEKDPLLEAKSQIRAKLAKAGANEVLTYSFVHGNLLQKAGQDAGKAYQVANALSPDLQYYRISLMPSLLEKVHPNIKAGFDEFALFELGKVHDLDHIGEDGLPGRFEYTALVVTAADKLKKPGSAYYEAQKYLNELVGAPLDFKPLSEDMQKFPVQQPYAPGRSAMVSLKNGGFLGVIGEFKPSVAQGFKLPKYSAGFEIDTTALQKALGQTQYVPLPRFPKVIQDITLQIPGELTYQELFGFVQSELDKAKPENSLVELAPVDIYQKEKDHKNVTLRLQIASYERTLTDSEVNKLLDEVAAAAKSKLQVERV